MHALTLENISHSYGSVKAVVDVDLDVVVDIWRNSDRGEASLAFAVSVEGTDPHQSMNAWSDKMPNRGQGEIYGQIVLNRPLEALIDAAMEKQDAINATKLKSVNN